MSNNKEKTLFVAMFERYEQGSTLLSKKVHLREVRTRTGELIKKHVVFNEDISSKIIGNLTTGEYISFLANIKFENIEFKYPHGKMEVI